MATRIGDDKPNTLEGTLFADFIDGKGGDDILTGKSGADVIVGGTGNDKMDGGNGDDLFRIGDDHVGFGEVITGGTDFDMIEINSAFGAIAGTFAVNLSSASLSSIEALKLSGSVAAIVNIRAGQIGGGLSSALHVSGNSSGGLLNIAMNGDLSVNLSAFTFSNWTGSISLTGEADGDRITGSSQADRITPGDGQDISKGMGGNDVFVIDAVLGNEFTDGGSGVDTLELRGASTSLGSHDLRSIERIDFDSASNGGDQTVFLRTSQFGATEISTSLEIEASDAGVKVVDIVLSGDTSFNASGFQFLPSPPGTTFVVDIAGSGSADVITGSVMQDVLTGAAADDLLIGGLGNDLLDGGTGDDIMLGGTGNDIYIVDAAGDIAAEILVGADPGGKDRVDSSVSHTLSGFIENLTLTGVDLIDGKGNGLGNVMIGNASTNVLRGEAGADTLRGGQGADQLFGGTGPDVFDYSRLADSRAGASNRDQIGDFAAADDAIDVSRIDANSALAGLQDFVLDTGGGLTAGEFRLREIGGNTFVEFNTDADVALEMQIMVVGVTNMSAADILV